jgi:hypothetical protein
MARLLTRTQSTSDPEIFTGLVIACRFCGLLDASLAADRQARRLDPTVRTSVMYTHFMLGDWERAIGQRHRHLEVGDELDVAAAGPAGGGNRLLSRDGVTARCRAPSAT